MRVSVCDVDGEFFPWPSPIFNETVEVTATVCGKDSTFSTKTISFVLTK